MGFVQAGSAMMEQPSPAQLPSNHTTRGSRLTYNANSVLARQQLAATVGDVLFTVPAQVTYIMTNFSVFNSSFTDTVIATMRLVAVDGVNDATSDYWEAELRPRELQPWSVEEVLTPGYQIVAFADLANLVNIKINGVNLVQQ